MPRGAPSLTASGLIGGQPDQVGFAANSSLAWASAVMRHGLARGRVLVAQHVWGPNLRALRGLGAEIEVLPPLDASGDLAAWAARIDDDVTMIEVPMVTSLEGRRYPVETIGRLARPEGCALMVDAAQALGQVPVDVGTLGADILVATGRKWLRGPRGTGLAWARPGLAPHPSPAGVESSDHTVVQRLGLGAAIEVVLARGEEAIAAAQRPLRAAAAEAIEEAGLEPVPGALPTTGAFAAYVPEARAERLAAALVAARIEVKWPDPAKDEPEAGLGRPGHRILRVAAHVTNTPEDIDRLAGVLRSCP